MSRCCRNFHRCIVFAYCFLPATLLTGCADSRPPLKIAINQSMADLNLLDTKGQPYELKLASGKVLLLNIWASWCPPCRDEMLSLDRLANRLDPGKFMLVGMSMDNDPHIVREYLREQGIQFPSYVDPDMKIATQRFGLRVYPTTLIISPQGVLLAIIEGWRNWQAPELVKVVESFSG